jgi:dihydroorotate dehydrogenase (fumarate)
VNVDLSTTYLGLKLNHPLMIGASPIAGYLDLVKRAEDAGVAAIVMNSLFEEQIDSENLAREHLDAHSESFGEALSFLPSASDFLLGPDAYLEQIGKVKAAVSVPVIGSLNGITNSGWLSYAKQIEEAGADALELNLYYVASNPDEGGADVEKRDAEIVTKVCQQTKLPVAVKLSPFFSSVASLAKRLQGAGAKGLVLFNRFYQPDIDIEELETTQQLKLSDSSELLLRLRWLAILSGRLDVSLAVSGGVHTSTDALKAVMAGAHAVQVVSAVLKNGPEHIAKLRDEMAAWLEKKEYESLAQAQGSMNLAKSPQPLIYERGNYVKLLQGYARSMATR